MKWMILAGLCLTMVCSSGCVKNLPPHEELNQAVKKSFDVTGFNYRSQSRVTNLSLANLAALPATTDKNMPYVGAALDIVRGFSVNIAGAVDLQSKKTEALYDLHYNKDNVEVSVRLPLLIDYNSQTIYIGPSLLSTLLNIVFPREATAKEQLIRINVPELLQEAAASSPELAKLSVDERFSAKNMDVINNVFKATIIKAVAKLDDARFSDQPLTEEDRKSGVKRRIQIKLDRNDTIAMILDLVDNISQTLFQEGAISKSEYAVLLMLTDRQKLDQFIENFDLAMTQDVSVADSGYIRQLVSRMTVTDQEGNFSIGLENVSTFDRYNAPHFAMAPETSQIIEFKEVLNAIMAITPKNQKNPPPAGSAPDDGENTPVTPQSDGGAPPPAGGQEAFNRVQ